MASDSVVAWWNVSATALTVASLIATAYFADQDYGNAQDAVAIEAAERMAIALPGQACIPFVEELDNGSFCEPLALGCESGIPTAFDFTNATIALPIWQAAITCQAISIINVHDETDTINSTMYMTDPYQALSTFYSLYLLDGQPKIFTSASLVPKGEDPPSILLNSVVVRLDSTDDYNYLWMNLTQSERSCMKTQYPLNNVTNYVCAATQEDWYFTAPFCRTYSCTGGIDIDYYTTLSNYIAVRTNAFRGQFLFLTGLSVGDMNAYYSGIVGALVACGMALFALIVVACVTSWGGNTNNYVRQNTENK